MHCEIQKIKEQLYRTHSECANTWNSVWQYIKTKINSQLDKVMDSLEQKLDALQGHKPYINHNTETMYHIHSTQNNKIKQIKLSCQKIKT